ncbi:MAG: LamG-like jellyroll fold domain-containing protein [Cyanobacteriota bacterium]|nr:LamG-like jellyroll fold domain-containing protein [Cyanobacteriota bacterium]
MRKEEKIPRKYDAVKGGKKPPPTRGAVLGGIEGVKMRLNSTEVKVRAAAVVEAIKYGEAGLDLIIQALKDRDSLVRKTAKNCLKKKLDYPKVKKALEESNCQSLYFDGIDDYLEITDASFLRQIGSGNFTFSAWVKGSDREQTAHPQILSNRGGFNGPGLLFGFHCQWGGSSHKIPYVQLDGQNFINYQNPPNLLDNTWHHFAASKIGDALQYYADGREIGSVKHGHIPKTTVISKVRSLFIGWDRGNSGVTRFKGNIKEVRIWNIPRSAVEINADMYAYLRGNEPGLIGYWKLNEGEGNVAKDYSASKSDAKILGASWQEDDGFIENN